jgi:hypothetical protein
VVLLRSTTAPGRASVNVEVLVSDLGRNWSRDAQRCDDRTAGHDERRETALDVVEHHENAFLG